MIPAAFDQLMDEVAAEITRRVLAGIEQEPRQDGEQWRLLDVEEVAARLGRSTRWVRDRAKSGDLPWVRLDGGALAFDLADVQAFAAARRVSLERVR